MISPLLLHLPAFGPYRLAFRLFPSLVHEQSRWDVYHQKLSELVARLLWKSWLDILQSRFALQHLSPCGRPTCKLPNLALKANWSTNSSTAYCLFCIWAIIEQVNHVYTVWHKWHCLCSDWNSVLDVSQVAHATCVTGAVLVMCEYTVTGSAKATSRNPVLHNDKTSMIKLTHRPLLM